MAKQYTLKVFIPTLEDERTAAVILPTNETPAEILQSIRNLTYEDALYNHLMGELETDLWLEVEFELGVSTDTNGNENGEHEATIRILSYSLI